MIDGKTYSGADFDSISVTDLNKIIQMIFKNHFFFFVILMGYYRPDFLFVILIPPFTFLPIPKILRNPCDRKLPRLSTALMTHVFFLSNTFAMPPR